MLGLSSFIVYSKYFLSKGERVVNMGVAGKEALAELLTIMVTSGVMLIVFLIHEWYVNKIKSLNNKHEPVDDKSNKEQMVEQNKPSNKDILCETGIVRFDATTGEFIKEIDPDID